MRPKLQKQSELKLAGRIIARAMESLIRFFCLRPQLIEYRLKQSMPEKIARCFVTGSTKQTHRSPFSEPISDQKIWLSTGSLRFIPLIRSAEDIS
jgi:hypothetical protein